LAEITRIDSQIKAAEAELPHVLNRISEIEGARHVNENRQRITQDQVSRLKRELEEASRDKADAEAAKGNKVGHFGGAQMVRAVEEIQRERGWRDVPIGPLGSFIHQYLYI